MDAVVPLAGQVVAILAPFLPYLVAAGQKVADGAVKELEGKAGQVAQALWERLNPRVEAKPAAQEAVQDVAASPDDQDAQASLRVQVRKLLSDEPALAEELARVLEEHQQTGAITNVTASGDRSVALGRDVQGSTIITGDRSRVG